MRTGVAKGIVLEQNKEPMLSREMIRLPTCEAARQPLGQPISSTPALLAPYEIVMLAKEAHIIDESDGRRLWKKLAQAARESIGGIVVDAIDDEPYISSQLGPALWNAEKLAEGITLAKRSVGASKVSVEIYKNLLDIDIKIPAALGGVKVDRVGGTYPAEQRTKRMLRRENTLVIGACALLALRRAAYEGLAHTTCFVTVAGDCVGVPGNYEVPIGSSVSEVLAAAGLVANPKRLVAGGSMTGFGVVDPDTTLIMPTTRGVLAFAERHALIVVSDEIHADLVYPGARHLPFASLSQAAAAR
ncbi:MAG: SLBB domain-containing protein, partial [Oscillospiraceae bacterium]